VRREVAQKVPFVLLYAVELMGMVALVELYGSVLSSSAGIRDAETRN
jgi:hypothetical protein